MLPNYLVEVIRLVQGVDCLYSKLILVIQTCFNSCSCQGRKVDNHDENRGRCSQLC